MNAKKTGVGSLKCLSSLGFSHMEPLRTRPWRKRRCSPCEFLPSILSITRPSRSPSLSAPRVLNSSDDPYSLGGPDNGDSAISLEREQVTIARDNDLSVGGDCTREHFVVVRVRQHDRRYC